MNAVKLACIDNGIAKPSFHLMEHNSRVEFRELKRLFLTKLKGNTLPYKRYMGTPLRYPGGKSLATGLIIEHFPNDIKSIVSPFIGGGSVEIASAVELDLRVKAFDIFDILVNFWQVLIKDNHDLYEALIKLEPDKKHYDFIKVQLKQYWDKKINLEPLILARNYYFNFNLSYGPGFLGWLSNVYANKERYLKNLEKIKNFYSHNLSVECLSFENVIEEYPNDFLYLDPPYFLEGDSKMFKGIYPQRNFPVHHNNFNHQLLADLLNKHKGRFILSYNDCQWVRNTYKRFKILEPRWQYTMGQGEKRIGKNRIQRGDKNVKKSHELLILNI